MRQVHFQCQVPDRNKPSEPRKCLCEDALDVGPFAYPAAHQNSKCLAGFTSPANVLVQSGLGDSGLTRLLRY